MFMAVKDLRYGTRRLKAGDTFDARRGDGKVLCIIGLAKEIEDMPVNELGRDEWRQCYRAVFGHDPDGRWSVARIRKELGR